MLNEILQEGANSMTPKPTPKVELLSIPVRDHQRRLRLVFETLDEELHLRCMPSESTEALPEKEPAQALAATTTNSGGYQP